MKEIKVAVAQEQIHWGLVGGGYIHFDNSTSSGFLRELFDNGYMSGLDDWTDPSNPPESDHDNRYNCRYVTLCTDKLPIQHNNCTNPIKYFLHCTLEGSPDEAKNDGGTNDEAFESFGPDSWVCLTQIPN